MKTTAVVLFVTLGTLPMLMARAAESPDKAAVDLAHTSRMVAETHPLRGDSPFAAGLPITGFGRDSARLEQELRGKVGPVSLLLTGRYSAQETKKPETKLIANEAFIDFGAGENRFTVGKKILSGDVGYAFRPLDVVQREARMKVMAPALEGIPSLIWERYSAQSAWSVILANPGYGTRGEARDDGSLTLRHYNRWNSTDLHGVARFSSRTRYETGLGFSSVPDESLELHGSLLAQGRGERQAPVPLPVNAPPTQLLAASSNADNIVNRVNINHPLKALAGLTWTFENGVSLLAETWWDGTANTAAEWRTLAQQTRQRQAMLGMPRISADSVTGAMALSTRMFQATNLNRRGNLGRISWTDPSGSGWSTALDIIHSPEDGGWSATLSAAWVADKLRLEGGIRRYGGKPDSAYRLLPEKGVLFIGASIAY